MQHRLSVSCTYTVNGHLLAYLRLERETHGMGCASMVSRVVFVVRARVAQRIERHRPKVGVGGSSPSAGTALHSVSALCPRDSSIAVGEAVSPLAAVAPPGRS